MIEFYPLVESLTIIKWGDLVKEGALVSKREAGDRLLLTDAGI